MKPAIPRLLMASILALLVVPVMKTNAAAQHYRDYTDARSIVQRTQDDLGALRSQGPRNDKERERVDNARKHLSDFDRNLSHNKFDKDRLDSAIDDVKNVVENNTLEGRDRDALTADLADLRRVRAMRKD